MVVQIRARFSHFLPPFFCNFSNVVVLWTFLSRAFSEAEFTHAFILHVHHQAKINALWDENQTDLFLKRNSRYTGVPPLYGPGFTVNTCI
jgi:hypothetical protein